MTDITKIDLYMMYMMYYISYGTPLPEYFKCVQQTLQLTQPAFKFALFFRLA